MYGSQPPAARRLAQLPQHLADGGLVARMKSTDAGPATFGARGLSQLRDMVPRMAAMGFQQAQTPAPAPAPVSDPRAAQLMAMIPRMEAMGYKQQPQMLAHGGLVRGPGTGTSDSIPDEAEPGTFIMPADSTEAIGPSALEKMGTVPVRLSDGEFKLPPKQVMALGTAVLKLLKDATHEPVNGVDGGQTDAEVAEARGFAPGAADRMAEMPEQLFADGGRVENDVTRVGNSYSGGNVGGGITVNGAAPAGTYSENPAGRMASAPAPRPDPSIVSTIRIPQAATATTAPAQPAPATPAVAQPAAPMGWAERNAQRNLEVTASSIMDSPERRMAQAALAPPPPAPAPAPVAAPAPAPLAAGFQPVAQRMGTLPGQQPLGFQPRRYADGGTVEDDLQKRLAQIPAGGPAGWNGGGSSGSGGGAGGVTGGWDAPVAAPAPAAPAGALSRAASLTSAVAAPAPAVQALGAMPDTPPTAQAMDAGQSLARRGAADALASMPNAPAPVQAPTVRHSGNDWQARNNLRNAEVSAASITNQERWGGAGAKSPDRLAYQQALATDASLQAAEPGLAAAAMKENSETNRATLRERSLAAQAMASERGAMDRTLIKEQGDNTRTGLTAYATTEAARIKAQQELTEQQRKAALKNPETSTALRKEFEGLPEVKNYKQALPAYKGIEDALKRNTPMSDINIVYGIAKLYDPNSVVREGEYATVANAPNIPERVKGWVQYATNGGKLTPEVKKQIMDEASSRMLSFQNEFEGSSARYRDIAERSNADPTLVISSDYKPAVTRKTDQPAAPKAGHVEDGYRFKGGDISNPASWEKVQ